VVLQDKIIACAPRNLDLLSMWPTMLGYLISFWRPTAWIIRSVPHRNHSAQYKHLVGKGCLEQ